MYFMVESTDRAARIRPAVVWERQPLRALLFTPADQPRKTSKVGRFGADACVIDLEDAVADERKAAAREATAAFVESYDDPSVLVVRVNGAGTGLIEGDLDAVVHPNVDAILVPKVEDPETLEAAAARIAGLEGERGAKPGSIRLIALIETAVGLARVEQIACAASPRLLTLVFGLVDFTLDIGVDLGDNAFEQLLYARSRIVVAARVGKLVAPIDGPYMKLDDHAGAAEQARRSRSLGFQGQVTVYPPQVEHVQGAYASFTDEEIAHAERVVEAFEAGQAEGVAAIRVDEHFVDYPVYHRAKRMLDLSTLVTHA
jgi:citrate lyase subunit beta/citryl-CoA lyase